MTALIITILMLLAGAAFGWLARGWHDRTVSASEKLEAMRHSRLRHGTDG